VTRARFRAPGGPGANMSKQICDFGRAGAASIR
jgi:hypothetical protein